MSIFDKLAMARGDILCDLVFKNGKIINVFTKEIEEKDLAISDGFIIGVGDYQAKKTIDLKGAYISPGFIDGHVHIESSMLTPEQYAKMTIPRGTTSIVADCHEIANVLGKDGIDFMLKASENSLQDVFMMIPSCVPSTPYESNGAKLTANDINPYLNHPSVKGLGEMMDYVGAVKGDKEVIKKISDYKHLTIDGHGPDLTDKDLNAYILAGVETDHECTRPEELVEKVRKGMYIHLREGSQTKNVYDLLPGLNPNYYQQILFCSDDLHPSDIKSVGHIDRNIRIAIEYGLDPIQAIAMATINIARCYHLKNIGAIAPGYKADFVIFDDMKNLQVKEVYKSGKLIGKNNEFLHQIEPYKSEKVLNTVHVKLDNIDLSLRLNSDLVHVIGLVKNNITTKNIIQKVKLDNHYFNPKNNPGLLKLAVVERHHNTGNIGFGIVSGYGLKNGAIAMSIAHDSHNIICLGDNDQDMLKAIEKIKEMGGGIVLSSQGEVIENLALEVAGLMTLKPGNQVIDKLENLEEKIRSLGVEDTIEDPFLQLAFLSLAVIPKLKVTDKGLFDVEQFKIIPLEAGDKS